MFWVKVLEIFDTQMQEPASYGLFHIVWIVLSIAAGIALCVWLKDGEKIRSSGDAHHRRDRHCAGAL